LAKRPASECRISGLLRVAEDRPGIAAGIAGHSKASSSQSSWFNPIGKPAICSTTQSAGLKSHNREVQV
jgi:hypothetical protein